jgi:hypothetical protein
METGNTRQGIFRKSFALSCSASVLAYFSYLKMRHDRDFEGFPCEWLKAPRQRQRERALREHSSCSQVKGDTSTQTETNVDKVGDSARRVAI